MKDKANLLHKKKWIQWILDFANMDLSSLSPASRKYLLEEMRYFCSKAFLRENWYSYERNLSSLTENEIRDLTEVDDTGRVLDLPQIQKKVIEFLHSMNSIREARRSDRAKDSPPLIELPDVFSYIRSPSERLFEIERCPVNPSAENWLILNFINLIDKFDTYPIHRCIGKSKNKECGRYFLNLSNRAKSYCTSSCASKSIQTNRRKSLKEEGKWEDYLKKMKKYQKKRYRQKIKAKLGPKVRVGRKEG